MIRKLKTIPVKPIILICLLTISCLSLQARDNRSWLRTAGLELTVFPASSPAATVPSDLSLDELARLVSGLPTGNPALKPLEEDQAWLNYQAFLEAAWKKFETRQLSLIDTWSKSELAVGREKTDFLFYPFGGPDLITAFSFFPQAGTYLLVGLEPGGYLPRPENFQARPLTTYLSELQTILSDYFKKGYFITTEMTENLNPGKINGVLPLLCLFLERTGHKVTDLKRVEFDEQGQPFESEYTVPGPRIKRPAGFKLSCCQTDSGQSQTVYYISCDLSDERFGPGTKFYAYLNSLDHWSCLIKSASYLLHFKNFRHLRQLVLDKSQMIVQDDTGVPYKYFLAGHWEIKLYGRYGAPVKDFSAMEQKELQAAYANKDLVKTLPFHFGYHWQSRLDSLIIAEKTCQAHHGQN